jgi:Tfp pilus assembly protein PilV
MKLELSQSQAQTILQLADAAVRAHGLQVVRQAVTVMDILDAAAAADEAESTEVLQP